MGAFYNENDPKAAAWLRELIKEGHIADGVVDERSISDLKPDDLTEFTQCHFFAGIGGWSLALRLAGWPDGRPVWTGSCPCQPYSAAGKGLGDADPRNLWPAFFRLIRECRPDTVFGEQVESAVGHGWLDGISADLEGEGYACGAAVLGAHSVGAPHIRQRLYWVAVSQGEQSHRSRDARGGRGQSSDGGTISGPAWVKCECCDDYWCNIHGMHTGECECPEIDEWGDIDPYTERCSAGGVGEPIEPRLERLPGHEHDGHQSGRVGEAEGGSVAAAGAAGPWSAFNLIPCADGKARRIEPGTFPLAHGVPGRVGLLRGYGNAIVPQVAAEFIKAFIEINYGT